MEKNVLWEEMAPRIWKLPFENGYLPMNSPVSWEKDSISGKRFCIDRYPPGMRSGWEWKYWRLKLVCASSSINSGAQCLIWVKIDSE